MLKLSPMMIRYLKRHQFEQTVRTNGPSSHFSKTGTPTMGGLLIILTITISTLLWIDLSNTYYWIILATLFLFGLIGGADDLLKIKHKNHKGLPAKWKYFHQSWVIGLIILSIIYLCKTPETTQILIPFIQNFHISLGGFYYIFAYFVIIGSSNAVNLTDGLDGLVIMPIILVSAGLSVFAYLAGNAELAAYAAIPFVPYSHELIIVLSAMIGSGLGFLWFNTYPAEIFMGDVGSLALGAMLGVIAIMINQELILFIMSGIFVLETLSVILQVGSFKLTGKRIFKMAPLHHHFELKGWSEPKIIIRFWIINILFVIIGLSAI